MRASAVLILFAFAIPAAAQEQTPPPHDITQVDTPPPGGAIAVPLPEHERKKLERYDIPELSGARQALGSQLIDGKLPRPLIDYVVREGEVEQRLSIFDGGLVAVGMRGAGGVIRKKVIIPEDALQNYLKKISPSALTDIRQLALTPPADGREALLRVYSTRTEYVERRFDPSAAPPRKLNDALAPLRDLLRTISEDREVTNTIAGYMPKPGDQLVGDDQRVYLVKRVIDQHIVELSCTTQPVTIYVEVKTLYNYFIGRAGAAQP
jgi:hypothetical protein